VYTVVLYFCDTLPLNDARGCLFGKDGGGGRGEGGGVVLGGGVGRLLVGGNWGIEDPRARKDLGGRATETI